MPHELYLIRMIHHCTKRPFPGERLWTADQLTNLATVRFLRARNREGCDVFIQPFAEDRNAGYILLDLDDAHPAMVSTMQGNGDQPCLVLQTSPGHLQAWIHVSSTPLQPAIATAIGKQLALAYSGDWASTDWRHLGRLAGFTNQKPQRRAPSGYAPWVRIVHSRAGLASNAEALLHSATEWVSKQARATCPGVQPDCPSVSYRATPASIPAARAIEIYQTWMRRWHIEQRFARPDWSIVDLWVARALLAQGMPPAQAQAVLRLGSPQFPRGHGDPDDYLRRTLARAVPPFPAPSPPVYAAHAGTSAAAARDKDCSNSTGGR